MNDTDIATARVKTLEDENKLLKQALKEEKVTTAALQQENCELQNLTEKMKVDLSGILYSPQYLPFAPLLCSVVIV